MTITTRTRNIASATGTDVLGNRWSATGSVLVRTSSACVTVAGVQDTESCLLAETTQPDFQMFLPVTLR